ncbi:T9SS-dependent M36 family metallopeptidase [Flavobacterium aciduliphilum]|uniref:Putative secreted protein (Por secretion system target) n=1 Tax=Flavobacterium aciduliphilum TaxID=1101402 RepID=A0A328YI87_9FLAO|nr:T9SS-dependent M36 family metallopeptidase [Flavobacterium aciduliphilum]RAR71712.1 putative secreted protein (Por secretion system target) [Flavobacterium aciduliphilum]
MKKITSLLMILFSVIGFSQDYKGKIQNYLDENKGKLNLTSQDISDWFIESTGSSESTNIDTYWIKQRYHGIEIFNATSNVWVKNGEIINIVNGFIPNINSKINTVSPSLSVLDALKKGFIATKSTDVNGEIIQTIGTNEFKISNGTLNEEPITAELVYQPVGNSLKLAWYFNFYTQDHNHLWSIRIDAVNGALLEKHDMVISCNFDNHKKTTSNKGFSFYNNVFKQENNLTVAQIQGGSYRVVPFNYESPNHHTRDLIANPENATASPKGWHDTNTLSGTTASLKYTYLRGNNAWARADYTNANPTATSTTSTANGYSPTNASLTFDFPYPGTSVAAKTYIDAATTNLFYMNNILHDIWYQYGFNEANGNFQKTNYGTGGGSAGDFVWADAQDGSTATTPTLNNANFSTPVDGSSPRMQMYLWSYRKVTQLLTVNTPSDIAGAKYTSDNVFSPGHVNVPVAPAMIQSDIVLFDDGTPDVGQTDNADACSAAVNASAISGHITIIRRSTSTANGGTPCTFIQKALYAKAAGATAAIIVNNDDANPDNTIGMSGADATITIPVLSVSLNTGEAIIAKLVSGQTVNAKIQSPTALDLFVNTDGDLDNGVIAHEFGHGISTRLSGGPANSSCLNNEEQMGEGWSDWFAMMLTMHPGDVGTTPRGLATFVINEDPTGYGLRNYPYTTDMSINPETFATVNNNQYDSDGDGIPDTTESHNVGEVWATMLWDLSWAYINKYGYDDNKYTGTGGNNKVMRLVLDAIKMQPCSPTFVQARDAILAADLATTAGENYCMIWEVFARRGLGLHADSGDTNSSIDQVEDFTVPTPGTTPATGSNCTLSVNYFGNQDLFRVYPNPTNGQLNIRINNYVGKVSIDVIDINGRLVDSYKNEDFNIEKSLNLNNLQSGMYILKVSGDSLNFTQKILKN